MATPSRGCFKGQGASGWERGITMIEMLVAIALATLLLAAILYASSAFTHSLRQSAALQSATTGAETLVDSLERDAHSAQAIFTPARDVDGNDNSDGHEVAFYARDIRGAGHFWSYCYKSGAGKCRSAQTAGSVGLYKYSWSDLPQNGGNGTTLDGTVADNVTAFTSQTVPASSLLDATINPISAAYFQQAGITSVVDVSRQMGYPGVVGGNVVTILNLKTVAGPRVVHLLAGTMTTRRTVIVGYYTPAPNAMNGSTVSFWSPLDSTKSGTITENNYGTRTTNPPQDYRQIISCNGSTTWSPNGSPLPPANDNYGTLTLSITPIKKIEPSGVGCDFTYADNTNQTASIHVTIGATQAPTATLISPAAPVVNDTITFGVQEGNYAQAPLGGFTAATSGTCDSTTYVAASGGYPAPSESEQWTVHANARGTCTITFTDVYGQQASYSIGVGNGGGAPATPAPTCSFAGGVGSGWVDNNYFLIVTPGAMEQISFSFVDAGGNENMENAWIQNSSLGTFPLTVFASPNVHGGVLGTLDGVCTYGTIPVGTRTPAPGGATPTPAPGGCPPPTNTWFGIFGGPCDVVQCQACPVGWGCSMLLVDVTTSSTGPADIPGCGPTASPTPRPTPTPGPDCFGRPWNDPNYGLGCTATPTPSPTPTCTPSGNPGPFGPCSTPTPTPSPTPTAIPPSNPPPIIGYEWDQIDCSASVGGNGACAYGGNQSTLLKWICFRDVILPTGFAQFATNPTVCDAAIGPHP